MKKKEVRQKVREQKKLMSVEERLLRSHTICRKLMTMARWQVAETVLLYHALPDEVDTALLLETGRKAGKTLLLPVVVGDELELRVFDGELKLGAYGILEPSNLSELFVDYGKIDLVVVPGMAFDRGGHRLGRGKGYYDKLLCQFHEAYKVGVCFDFQLLDEVPAEDHDIMMDEVLSL